MDPARPSIEECAAEATGENAPVADCPYRGLVPFEERDERYFFGRSKEVEIVANNLFSSRITVLYGESGVGKSSLLRAGVVPLLMRKARANQEDLGETEFCPVLFREWSGDAQSGLIQAIITSAAQFGIGLEPERTVEAQIEAAAGRAGRVLLILDQVEDYFQYHASEKWLASLVGNRRSPARILLALREDSLALLDAWKSSEPGVFQNLLRIEHLGLGAARDATVLPLEQYNRDHPEQPPVAIEEGAVDWLVREIGEPSKAVYPVVQAAYLQLVLMRWWEADAATGVLKLDTFKDKLGGAKRIVDRYLDEVVSGLSMAEQTTAERMFDEMATQSGRKIAQTVSDLERLSDAAQVGAVLRSLGAARLIGSVPPPRGSQPDEGCFEFSHDLVAKAARRWCEEFRFKQEAREREIQLTEANRTAQRFRRLTVGLMAVVVVAVAALIAALSQYRKAQQATSEATQETVKAQAAEQRAKLETANALAATQVAEVERFISALDSKTKDAALWELYRAPEAIRFAVLMRAISDERTADILEYEGGRLAYATVGVNSRLLDRAAREIDAACAGQKNEYRLGMCVQTLLALDGGAERTIRFLVRAWSDYPAFEVGKLAELLATAKALVDRATARRMLQALASSAGTSAGSSAFAVIPWTGNEDVVGRVVQAEKEGLRGPGIGSFPVGLAAQLDSSVGIQLLSAASGDRLIHSVNLSELPREWIAPLEQELRRKIMQLPQGVGETEVSSLLSLNLDVEGTRRSVAAIASAGNLASLSEYLQRAIRVALGTAGDSEAVQVLEAPSGMALPAPLLAVVAGGLKVQDYAPILLHLFSKYSGGNDAQMTVVMRAFASRFPTEALKVLSPDFSDRGIAFRIISKVLADRQLKLTSGAAKLWFQRLKAVQPIQPNCASFAAFVRPETVADIVEVIKWPTCSQPDRWKLLAALALVTHEDFAETRYGKPAVDWRKFVEWAERNHYDATVLQPKSIRKLSD